MGNGTIQKGDILLFSPSEEDVLGRCISTLTRSDVCHTAMVYGDGQILEVDGKGITVNKFVQDEQGELVYVRRLRDLKDPALLMKSADRYLKKDIKFDFASWAILSWLLMVWPTGPIPFMQKKLEKLVLYSGSILDSLLNRMGDLFFQRAHHQVMICSQMIYKCYEDCGKDYRIQVEGGLFDSLFETNNAGIISQFTEEEVNIISRGPVNWYKSWEDKEVADAGALFLGEFMKKIQIEEDRNMPFYDEALSVNRIQDFDNLLDSLEKMIDILKVEKPVSSLYVTPANIKDAKNLEPLKSIRIRRVGI